MRGVLPPSSGPGGRSGCGRAAPRVTATVTLPLPRNASEGPCGAVLLPVKRFASELSFAEPVQYWGEGKKKRKRGFLLPQGFSTAEFIKISSCSRRKGRIFLRFHASPWSYTADRHTALCGRELLGAGLLPISSPLPAVAQACAKPWETTAHPGTVGGWSGISEAVAAPASLCPCTSLCLLLITRKTHCPAHAGPCACRSVPVPYNLCTRLQQL